MTPDEKLAHITRSLKEAGIDALVMGGHAVRYYGIDRNTIDFDFVTSLATPEELQLRLPQIESLGSVRAETVWRSKDFARFEIGRLPDGREEWLEFWIRNHLLGEFSALKARAARCPSVCAPSSPLRTVAGRDWQASRQNSRVAMGSRALGLASASFIAARVAEAGDISVMGVRA